MKALTVLTLSLLSLSTFLKEIHTFEVSRGECLSMPKILDIEDMSAGIHFEVKRDYSYDCTIVYEDDTETEVCKDKIITYLHYRYSIIKTTEHYTADGKLFTTSIKKTNREIVASSATDTKGKWEYDYDTQLPVDELAKQTLKKGYAEAKADIEIEIAKAIYESDYGVCADSYYK